MFRPGTSLSESEAQVGFLFHVMIGVNPLGEFRSVKGIGRTVDAEEIREGGRNHSPHTRVGQGKYTHCVIEWGMSNRTTLYDWIHAVEAGYGYKRQVWVVQLSRSRMPLRIYQLVDAWPVAWEGAELDANNNVVDTEQITIAYEAVTLVTMPEEITYVPGAPPQPVFEEAEDKDLELGGGGEEEEDEGLIGYGDALVTGVEPEDLALGDGAVGERIEEDLIELGAEVEETERVEATPLSFVLTPEELAAKEQPEREKAPGLKLTGEDLNLVTREDDEAPPLKMSGGLLFERTVFEQPKLAGDSASEEADA